MRNNLKRPMRWKIAGFTLIELIITVAISGILLATAIPSFRKVVRSNSSDAVKSSLNTALRLARSESVTRGRQVGVCGSSNLTSCTGGWANGWIVYLDTPANQTVSQVLRVFTADGTFAITTGSSNISFKASIGIPATAGVVFNIADNQAIAITQTLTLNASGTTK